MTLSGRYGYRATELDSVADAVARVLGVNLARTYHDDLGGDYWRSTKGQRPVRVFWNAQDEDGIWYHDEDPTLAVIVSVGELDRNEAEALLRLGGQVIREVELEAPDGAST